MERRKFLRFAGATGALGFLDGFLHPALGATWHQIGGTILKPIKVRLPLRGDRHQRMTVACGYYASVAIRSDGAVFGCGYGNPAGINTSSNISSFLQSVGISNAVALAAGERHSVALRSDGLVFASGNNGNGRLGNGATSNLSTFVQATGISNAVGIACGYGSSIALRADGLVFGCGNNGSGPLGINSTIAQSTYVQATGISNAVAAAAGGNHTGSHTVILRSDGLVYSCGWNSNGQLGINSTSDQSTFVQTTGISNAVAVACGYLHTLALRSDGLVFGCGVNGQGQLGINSTANQSTFVQATGISGAVAVAAGWGHTVALRSDGFVFASGFGTDGELGANSNVNTSTFAQATGISNAVAVIVASYGQNSVALRSDGLMFGTGDNHTGQLGNGSTSAQSTFVQMGGP